MGRHKIPKMCAQCGSPTREQKKYCGRACYANSKRRPVSALCLCCGVEFQTRQCEINEGRQFCSKSCKQKKQREGATE